MKTVYQPQTINHLRDVSSIVGDSHNLLILFELSEFGEKSFNELKRMTDINAVTLSKKLKILHSVSIVAKAECGNEVHYSLTNKGRAFQPLIIELKKLINKEK